ncbi:MAG TPA: chemotaxis protein CheW [Burkholderiaceae bacterium]|jgi:purine-binding chemotaxis protein CheW
MTKKKAAAEPVSSSPLAALMADEGSAALLRKRADELARSGSPENVQALEPFVHVRLGRSEEYGLPHRHVDEVVAVTSIARVPCAPPSIAGVINRRGQMLPVVDLQHFFGIESDVARGANAGAAIDIVVISAGTVSVGIRVDELLGVSEYRSDELSSVLASQGPLDRSHVVGLLKGRITILHIERILHDLCA